MSDLSSGYYMLTLWATAGDVSGAVVRGNFKAQYGESVVAELGKAGRGMFFGEVEKAMREAISQGASKEKPSLRDVQNAMLKASGYTPGLFGAVLKTAEEVGKKAPGVISDLGSGLKTSLGYVALIAVVIGVVYIMKNGKAFVSVVKGG